MKDHLIKFIKSLIQRKFLYIIYLSIRYWYVLAMYSDLNWIQLALTGLTDVGIYILFGIIKFEKVDIDAKIGK